MQKLKKAISFVFAVILSAMLPLEILAVTNKPVYNSNINETKKIALTFDDGPHPRNTPEILDVLKKYNVINDGHEIGNHTYSHHILKSKTKDEIIKEIVDTEKEISKKNEFSTTLIRPPCVFYDQCLLELAEENNYKVVLWSIDTHDWSHASTQSIVSNVMRKIKGGDIVLFHDYITGENNTPEALRIIIPRLLEQGYEFVTVSQLLQNT